MGLRPKLVLTILGNNPNFQFVKNLKFNIFLGLCPNEISAISKRQFGISAENNF